MDLITFENNCGMCDAIIPESIREDDVCDECLEYHAPEEF